MAHRVPQTALRGRSQSANDKLATGLGLFSIALGAAELFAPRALCRALGFEGHERLVQAYGVREVATGVAILASHDPTPWIWGRVAGDGLDLATLVTGFRDDNPQKGNVGVAVAAVLGVTVLDAICAQGLTNEKGGPKTATADYGDRVGFPQGRSQAVGDAHGAVTIPADMRRPNALRPLGAQ